MLFAHSRSTASSPAHRARPTARVLRALIVLAALAPASLAQTTIWVSADFGFDAPGGGTPQAPFRTIAYAIGTATSADLDVLLLPGIYTEANGEVFPIVLPASTRVRAVTPGTAWVKTTPTQVLPSAFLAPAGTTYVRLEGLTVTGNDASLRVEPGPGDAPQVEIEDCEIKGGFGIRVLANAAAVSLLARDSLLSGGNASLRANASNGGQFHGSFERVRVRGGPFHGVELIAGFRSTIHLDAEACAFFEASRVALRLEIDPGATSSIGLRHCTFHGNGGKSPGGAAISEAAPSPASTSVAIDNCVFWGNKDDLKTFHAGYTVANTVLQFPRPGTNVISLDPLLLNPDQADFHLLTGSPAIDLAPFPAAIADGDGDPIPAAATPLADAGVDEAYAHHAHLNPPRPHLFELLTLHVQGPPSQFAFLMLSLSPPNPTFGPHFRVGPQLFAPIPLAPLPASGALTLQAGTVTDAAVLGVPLWAQAGFFDATSGGITWAPNVFRVRFHL